ncbi:MAG: hypothetical protein CTY36_00955 [Methylocystis sp.]|nr:MAG: hypothetical protein CTY36_00955 [Methylocystis sp.]
MQEHKIFVLRLAAALTALAIFPIAGFVAFDMWSGSRCAEETTATGELDGAIAWRIARTDCAGGAPPFYDVSVGAAGRALGTAATSLGAPVPLEVRRLGADRIGVSLDRPWRGETVVEIRLRRTGGPAERIDLTAPEP